MAHTAWQGGGRIEEAEGKTGQAQGDQGWTRKEIGSTKEGIFLNCQTAMSEAKNSNFYGTQLQPP